MIGIQPHYLGQDSGQHCNKKRLTHTFKGETTCVKTHFISTKDIKEDKIEIEVNWTTMDLRIEGLLRYPMIDLSHLFDTCYSLEGVDLDFNGLYSVKEIILESMFKDCSYLRELKIANFSIENISGMSSMFLNCSSLKA